MARPDDRPHYMKGLSKPEPLVRVEDPCDGGLDCPGLWGVDCPDHPAEDETPMMMFWCVRHAVYETEVCDGDT